MIQVRPGEEIRLSADQIRNKYERFAPWYDPAVWLLEVALVRKLRRSLVAGASGKVLEVAVGTGVNLKFYPANTRLVAVDISPAMLQRARQRARRLNITAQFDVMDAQSLDFPDASFDTVVSSLAVCTFPDPVAALQEIDRVCKPDGRILMLEHGRSRSAIIARLQDRLAVRHARALACHWNREPRDIIADAGLRLASERQTLFGIFHALEVIPSRRPRK